MEIKNGMKHSATLFIGGGYHTLPTSGIEITLKQENVDAGNIETPFGTMPSTRMTRGEIVNLPPAEEGVVWYVNGLVFAAAVAAGRTDVIMGDSGKTAIRWTQADVDAGLCPAKLVGLVRAINTIIVP